MGILTNILSVALTLTLAAVVSAGSSGKSASSASSSSNDVLSPEGNVNWDVFMKTMTSCGTALNMEGTVKAINGYIDDCGIKKVTKNKLEPYKLACGVACVYKSLKLIGEDSKFQSDEKEIKKVIDKMKLMEDEKKAKNLQKELVICSKAAHLHNLTNTKSRKLEQEQ